MTSITDAPNPIIIAQSSPDRAPSLMMVRLTGPTGTERINPLRKPVRRARRRGCWPNMSRGGASFVVFFLLDLVAHLAGNAGANEPVKKVQRENYGKHDR